MAQLFPRLALLAPPRPRWARLRPRLLGLALIGLWALSPWPGWPALSGSSPLASLTVLLYDPTPPPAPLSTPPTVLMLGSRAMQPLLRAWTSSHTPGQPALPPVRLVGSDDPALVSTWLAARPSVLALARPLTPAEQALIQAAQVGPVEQRLVAWDALALITSIDLPSLTLTLDQAQAIICAGESPAPATWGVLGLPSPWDAFPIEVLGRVRSAGATMIVETVLCHGAPQRDTVQIFPAPAQVFLGVLTHPTAIGLVPYRLQGPRVQTIALQTPSSGPSGVRPSLATIEDGTYPLRHPLYLVWLPHRDGALLAPWITWVQSAAGQAVARHLGYGPSASGSPWPPVPLPSQ